MEWMGLVSRVEEDLERTIALGMLPEDGSLPSEQLLARRYGVSRATVREALLRLSTRGLVVRRQGRRTRAATLDEALTLESLSTVLHVEGNRAHPYKRRLLDGYFALKRDITVELLAICCEQASKADLAQLEQACLALEDAARWQHDRNGWVEQEFRLLRLAAGVADRAGHLLLIQSLERAFRGMAARVLPHLDSQAICQWARCTFHTLANRDAQGLRRELLPLLQACDGRVLDSLAPACATDDRPLPPPVATEPLCEEPSAPGPLPGANSSNLSACQTTSDAAPPTEDSRPESCSPASVPPAEAEPRPLCSKWRQERPGASAMPSTQGQHLPVPASLHAESASSPPPEVSLRHTWKGGMRRAYSSDRVCTGGADRPVHAEESDAGRADP